jgi:hypothetical protein
VCWFRMHAGRRGLCGGTHCQFGCMRTHHNPAHSHAQASMLFLESRCICLIVSAAQSMARRSQWRGAAWPHVCSCITNTCCCAPLLPTPLSYSSACCWPQMHTQRNSHLLPCTPAALILAAHACHEAAAAAAAAAAARHLVPHHPPRHCAGAHPPAGSKPKHSR